MGCFSWRTSNTGQSISTFDSKYGALPVKMLDNKGNVFVENEYEGYGVFGGKDFFELLAEMNGLKSDRDKGIDLYYSDNTFLCPKLVTINCNLKYEDLPDPVDCDVQGYFYYDYEDVHNLGYE